MLVAGKSAAAAAAWASVPEVGQVLAEQVWAPAAMSAPVAVQAWEAEAMVKSAQAHAPLPSEQAPPPAALPSRLADHRPKMVPCPPPGLPEASRRPGSSRGVC